MATGNSVLTSKSVSDLSGRWGLGILGVLCSGLVLGLAGIIPFGTMVVGGPMSLGLAMFSLAYVRGGQPEFKMIFDGWSNFEKACPVYIIQMIFVILGMICFIVPGVILALMYSQTMFLLVDEPDLGAMETLKKSSALMDGHKMRYFGLLMRMFGWGILCIFTLGIGFLWLGPYSMVSFANFYDDLNPVQSEIDITDHLV